MDTAKTIVENRVNGLGVTEALVVRAGGRRIVVELPGVADPEEAKSTVKQTALLEFVDMSSITQDEAVAMMDAGTTIVTDYSASSVISPTQSLTATVWHTVMTGSELKNAAASAEAGRYNVVFELSSAGAKTFGDYTTTHIGDVLAIVLDIFTPIPGLAFTVTLSLSLSPLLKLPLKAQYSMVHEQ